MLIQLISNKTTAEVTDDSTLVTATTSGLKVSECDKMEKNCELTFFQCYYEWFSKLIC